MSESEANTNTDRVLNLYREIGNAERHFNELTHQYRLLASTWLLGTFAAIGYILTNVGVKPNDSLSFYRELIIAAIALAGATGITLVWILDLKVYQKLLGCFFLAALALEDEHKWLLPIHHTMHRTQKDGNASVNIAWFYVGCTTILLVVGTVSLSLWVDRIVKSPASRWVFFLALGITCVWAFTIRHKSVSGMPANLEHPQHSLAARRQ